MWRATVKGLLAHKMRLGRTALAIVMGVAFVAGTFILTDTMGRAFDDLFATVNKGVAVEVSGVPRFESNGIGGETAGAAQPAPPPGGAEGEPAPRSEPRPAGGPAGRRAPPRR